jgi:hypothetical protein
MKSDSKIIEKEANKEMSKCGNKSALARVGLEAHCHYGM